MVSTQVISFGIIYSVRQCSQYKTGRIEYRLMAMTSIRNLFVIIDSQHAILKYSNFSDADILVTLWHELDNLNRIPMLQSILKKLTVVSGISEGSQSSSTAPTRLTTILPSIIITIIILISIEPSTPLTKKNRPSCPSILSDNQP